MNYDIYIYIHVNIFNYNYTHVYIYIVKLIIYQNLSGWIRMKIKIQLPED